MYKDYKGNNKPTWFVVSMIVYVENSKESSDKLLKLIREFSKVVVYKICDVCAWLNLES